MYKVHNSILMSVCIQVFRILTAWGKGPNSHWKKLLFLYVLTGKTLGPGFIPSNSMGLTSLPTAGCEVPTWDALCHVCQSLGVAQIPEVSEEAHAYGKATKQALGLIKVLGVCMSSAPAVGNRETGTSIHYRVSLGWLGIYFISVNFTHLIG